MDATDADLASLKRLFHVTSDLDLAAALGIDRSTIAQWKRRGRLPPRYSSLAKEFREIAREEVELLNALRQSIRGLVFRNPFYHLWLAAALTTLSAEDLEFVAGENLEERGKRLEARTADAMHRCLKFSQDTLGKVMPEGEDDYREIVRALAEGASPASPQ